MALRPPSFTAIMDFPDGEGFQTLPPHFYDERGVGEAWTHPCVSCKTPFLFNPHTVVSVRLNVATGRAPAPGEEGEAFPVCNQCVARLNAQRVAAGLEPVPLSKDSTR